MSATLLLGLAGIGAAAAFALKSKQAPKEIDDGSPLNYPDNSHLSNLDPRAMGAHSGAGGTATGDDVDPNDDDIVGAVGPVDEPEMPASGTGGKSNTFSQPVTLAPPNTAPPQPSIRYRTISMNDLAYGDGAVMGKTATSTAYTSQGPILGAIW